ncbi:PD-(D/E)XK nuclease family protein [Wenyingzhuangia sp. IMCC45533]
MKTFLQETASAIINGKTNLKNTICIVPSERAGIYLKQSFKEVLINKVSFLPKIISIENFIKEISGLESMDQVSLIFEFFKIYQQEYKGENPDTFERFIGWATIVIQDFNEIDRHLVNPKEIFNYLADIQNIKDWDPSKNKETDTMSNYMSFVEDLYTYYQKLTATLLHKKSAYQGLVYKKAFENCEEYVAQFKEETFCFIGFNALNKAEEQIFKTFLASEKNQIYWDVDEYYLDSKREAGSFIREFFTQWECLNVEGRKNFINNHFRQKKNIQILGSPLNVTGIKAATSFLNDEINSKETAFVLAEESLLPVVLNSIPSSVNKVNITMGYALSNIPLSGLFQSLFDLHLNKQKLAKQAFYYKDIISFLRHPYLTRITDSKNDLIIESITRQNLVFVSENEIDNFFTKHEIFPSVVNLFKPFKNVAEFLTKTIDFIGLLNQKLEGVDLLYVEGYRKVFQEIINLNQQYQYISNIKVLYKIFKKLLPLESVDFKGEALEGMQLMGVLETRCLDFKNVVLTSVNEGVLPSGTTERSFISFEVKKHFKMPTYLAKDAIFSYHFYRLIQRAENVYLIYNTKTNDFGGGEMSRFLTRLMIDKEADITHKNVVVPVQKSVKVAKEIIKTNQVVDVLISYFKKGVSPSRITDYMNDPLVFYKKMVLKIRETDAVEEEVAHNTLGTIVHDSLEFLYKPYLNKILVAKDVELMKTEAKKMVGLKFKEHFKEGDITTGKNRLISEVANQFVINFLNKELDEIKVGKEIVVKDLEMECTLSMVTPAGHQIKLRGKIDRVDEVDGVRRIVDYKTGKVEAKDLCLEDLSMATTDYKYHKIVQVMTYVLLYTETEKFDVGRNELQTGIYSFKNFKPGFLAMNQSKSSRQQNYNITADNVEAFKNSLYGLIDEILDNNRTFVENLENPYKIEA